MCARSMNQYCSCTAILEGFVASYYGSWGWEDPLEEGRAAHSSVLAWRIPWTEGPGGQQSWCLKESDMMSTHIIEIRLPKRCVVILTPRTCERELMWT